MKSKSKKIGPKLKEGVPANKATMLRINRILYAKLSETAVLENISMHKIINEAVKLRIDQFTKGANKRHKAHLAEKREAEEKENNKEYNINGQKYHKALCESCLTRKIISVKYGVCDDCRNMQE